MMLKTRQNKVVLVLELVSGILAAHFTKYRDQGSLNLPRCLRTLPS